MNASNVFLDVSHNISNNLSNIIEVPESTVTATSSGGISGPSTVDKVKQSHLKTHKAGVVQPEEKILESLKEETREENSQPE